MQPADLIHISFNSGSGALEQSQQFSTVHHIQPANEHPTTSSSFKAEQQPSSSLSSFLIIALLNWEGKWCMVELLTSDAIPKLESMNLGLMHPPTTCPIPSTLLQLIESMVTLTDCTAWMLYQLSSI
ncbi:uncharacterized protein LOC131610916 [Vicia villosa]|uniref:uncharacterized protein LOC131610916 n=1 Tax=Vicia villosa TaxID=3911 RepID=UPI00273C9169|nr:uncharacterized protein LOC131610916 [Vicia villosa]